MARAKRELYRKSKCRMWWQPQKRNKPGGTGDLLAPRLTAGLLGGAGSVICGTQSPMKMWGPLFRQQEEVLFGFPSTVFQSFVVCFICYLMVCSSGHREIRGVSAGPPRVPPCGTCAAHRLPASPSPSGWTNALCPSWRWGSWARCVCFLPAHGGAGTARETSPGRAGRCSAPGWEWTGAWGRMIRDSSLVKPSRLSPSKGEAGPAGFTSDSCAWSRLCSHYGSVSRLFNPSIVDICCCCFSQ